MNDFIMNFHFLRPWMLLFLLIPLGLYFKKLKKGGSVSSWADICDKNLLDFLLVNGSAKKTSVKKYIYAGLLFATLAAAGPTWKKVEIPTFAVENPNMFVLSLAQDMQLTDIAPSRLERAKYMISDLTNAILQGQFGIEVYSEEPYIITPITDDTRLIKNLMPQITPDIVPDRGDRLDRAIGLALERFKSAGYNQGNIILFSSDVGQRFDLALEKVKKAAALNYRVHVIDTSFDGNEKMKLLADNGNGVYLSIKNANLQPLADTIAEANAQHVRLSQNLRSNYIDYGYYLLFIPLFCVLIFFRRGMLILLFCCCFAVQAQAGFLKNDNQEGLDLFKQKKYDQALGKFTDNNWRGITYYMQDKPEDALKEFEQKQDSEAFYNKGVILTKMCKYQEALEAFDEAVKINPQNADAKYNHGVLKDLFAKAKENPSVLDCNNEQQQQENSQQNQDDSKDNAQQEENNKQDNSSQDTQQQEAAQNKDNQQNSDQQPPSENKSDTSQKNQEDAQGNNEEQQSQPTKQNDSQQKDDSSKENKQNSSGQDSNSQPSDKKNTPEDANNDTGEQNKSKNENGNDDNGTEEQIAERPVSLINAKKGNENEKYDEEALAVQRRYREIPEDTGGLLREFIKKEYIKGRYQNENM